MVYHRYVSVSEAEECDFGKPADSPLGQKLVGLIIIFITIIIVFSKEARAASDKLVPTDIG